MEQFPTHKRTREMGASEYTGEVAGEVVAFWELWG